MKNIHSSKMKKIYMIGEIEDNDNSKRIMWPIPNT